MRTITFNRAFTLIELLIVVAIIAILAAIAVPNFLEAQTRSKIARASSDLRNVATALEAYAVDNNVYPYAESVLNTPWMPPGGAPRVNPSNYQVGGLTTPIAYITSIPEDVFRHGIDGSPDSVAPVYYEKAGFNFVDGVLETDHPVQVPADAVAGGRLFGIGPDQPVTRDSETPRKWLLFSLGPDLQNHLLAPNGTLISRSRYNLNNVYDPTNGTVSRGNVLRFPGGDSFPAK